MKTIEVTQYGIKTNAIENETLAVAEWFAARKFKEIRGLKAFDNRIFAVIGETEKAYNVVLGTACNHVTTWAPKSLVSVDNDANEHDMTFVCDFQTAMEIAKTTRREFE